MSEQPLIPPLQENSPETQTVRQGRRDTKLAEKRDTTLEMKHATPSRLRVLIVEDNPDVLAVLTAFLHAWGHEVCEAVDGWAALRAADTFQPDVVVSDIDLPNGMDGCAVAQHLRGRVRLLVALTGKGLAEDRHRALVAGFDHYLVKPLELKTLRSLLAAVGRL